MAIEFKLAPLFGNGAVLCRRKEVRVWGTAADGQTITGRVTTADGLILSEGVCTARDGRFLLHLPPMEQATSCTLTVTCGQKRFRPPIFRLAKSTLRPGRATWSWNCKTPTRGKI